LESIFITQFIGKKIDERIPMSTRLLMLSLLNDCVGAILNECHGCEYVSRLLLASTCKEMLRHLPRIKLSTDILILQVIHAGSFSLYGYYQPFLYKPVWMYLLRDIPTLVLLGEQLNFPALSIFLKWIAPISPGDSIFDIILDRVVLTRPLNEAVIICRKYGK